MTRSRFQSLSTHNCLALPEEVRRADTLAALSKIYHRPIAEIQHINPGVETDQPLAPGTLVNIPDPGFATWIAARLSAELLVESSLADQERTELLQLLVPIAIPNPTVLDLVLARLLLAIRPADAALLDALERIAGPPIIRPLAAFEAKLPSIGANSPVHDQLARNRRRAADLAC